MREDDFTSTVDGAAAYERMRGQSDYDPADDRPDLSDVADDGYDPTRSRVVPCPVTREKDGIVTHCLRPLGHLSRNEPHEPNPWTTYADPTRNPPPPF